MVSDVVSHCVKYFSYIVSFDPDLMYESLILTPKLMLFPVRKTTLTNEVFY